MRKKFIMLLILSSTIIMGSQTVVQGKEINTTEVSTKVISTYNLDNYYIREILYSKGYPIDNNIRYELVNFFNINGTKTYVIDVYANDILISGGRLTITSYSSRDPYINGISTEKVKSLLGTKWSKKVKISNNDAIYKARYVVYMDSLKDIREEEVVVESLSLVEVNGVYAPCYSLAVTCGDTKEGWKILINAETGDVINLYKL